MFGWSKVSNFTSKVLLLSLIVKCKIPVDLLTVSFAGHLLKFSISTKREIRFLKIIAIHKKFKKLTQKIAELVWIRKLVWKVKFVLTI